MSDETCYMCPAKATTVEHAPPSCLFPEEAAFKDIGIEIENMRKELITVPSCAEHNNKKSKDDEFVRAVLVSNVGTNSIGQNQFLAKVLKAYKRRPALWAKFRVGNEIVVSEDEKGLFKTGVLTTEISRFTNAMEKIGRALYFHHFRQKWFGKVKVFNEFVHMVDGDEGKAYNRDAEYLRNMMNRAFAASVKCGENKEVFYYVALKDERNGEGMMRLTFYGNTKVSLLFHNRV